MPLRDQEIFLVIAMTLWPIASKLLFLFFSSNERDMSGFSSLQYESFPDSRRLEMREAAKRMFYVGYENYMQYAFPQDELDPVHCRGRGPDKQNPSNININDVLGNFSLTLLESLGTLAILGNASEFKRAVQLVLDKVDFNVESTVQVFETNIRVLGSLLSTHLLIRDPDQPFGDLVPDGYSDDLLSMATDLASRLLSAFENTTNGIPYPRVNLRHGVPSPSRNDTCTSGAGSLLVEFGILSRLIGDPVYEGYARRAVDTLWEKRDPETGLLGNSINIHSGEWIGKMSGIGAGLDSFYEYLLKSYILFGEKDDLKRFNAIYSSIIRYVKKGEDCLTEPLIPDKIPIYANVDMESGEIMNSWIDSLSAFFSGLQVLKGDVVDAVCSHALYYTIWRRFGALPERFNWKSKSPDVLFYPLRPELVESTYLLYRATRNPFYLHVGSEILESLEKHSRAKCGYTTLHNVVDKTQEDRMESFFLSETCKYLYLLFDQENYLNRRESEYLFTTEGHPIRIDKRWREKRWDESSHEADLLNGKVTPTNNSMKSLECAGLPNAWRYSLPLDRRILYQIERLVGLT
eukprot:m.78695 g.78695  ORF g.78695 m.78695 type:complete len:576 (+) comp36114_c0_seq9:62-1789(+)